MDEKISIQDVKEDLSYNDVLEVFVRVNSGGIVLTKSDLLFSTVILFLPEMENKFIEVVDELMVMENMILIQIFLLNPHL